MAPSVPAARPRTGSPFILLAVPLACLVWAFWPTLLGLVQEWQRNPQYSHGWLVPVFAAVLLWTRRNRLDVSSFSPSLWGLPFLALGIGMRLVGAYYAKVACDQMSLLPMLFGIGVLVCGRSFARWSWPAVLFLAFMIPLPYSAAIALSGPLQSLATIVSTFIMQVGGLPALAEGNVIRINDQAINIVEACSGLSMLMVFVALSTAMAMIVSRPLVDRLILLFSAVPIALTANILRVTVTGILYETTTGATAHAFFHDVAGWLMMPLALALLWIELKILNCVFVPLPASLVARPAVATTRRATARTQPAPTKRKRFGAKPSETQQPVSPGEPAASAAGSSTKPGS